MNKHKTFLLATDLSTCAATCEAETNQPESLYRRLGGIPAIRSVVKDFVGRILADDRVNRWFAHAANDPRARRPTKRR